MLDIDSDNNPYGMLQEEGPLKDVPSSVLHRVASDRNSGYVHMKDIRASSNNKVRRVTAKPPMIGEDQSVTYVKEYNKGIIEGLAIPSSEQSRAVENINKEEEARISLETIRRRLEGRHQTHHRDTLSPVPSSIKDNENENSRAIENVIPIKKKDIERSHKQTEKLSQSISQLSTKHLGMLLSFDNSSSYVEAFAQDGLGIENGISVEDSPFHFLRQLCNIDKIASYMNQLDLKDEYKDLYMEKTIDYYVKLASRENESVLKAELFRRTNNSQRSKAEIRDDTEKNKHGAYHKRQ